MQEGDSQVARGDRLETAIESIGLAPALGVDLAQQRLAEVGQEGALEAADEALYAHHADLEAGHPADRRLTLEHADLAVGDRGGHFPTAPAVPVVIA